MQAVIMAVELIGAGSIDFAVADGMEQMTGVPNLLSKHRGGARILATLFAALEVRGLCKGVASLRIGGGEATAIAIEAMYREHCTAVDSADKHIS